MHHHLDTYTYQNHLRTLPPQQKLIFALVVMGIALTTHAFTQGLIFIWLSIWTVYYARIPYKVYSSTLTVMVIFFLTSVPALVVEIIPTDLQAMVHVKSLGGIEIGNWFVFISQPGLTQALEMGIRSLACFAGLLFIIFTIPFTDLLSIGRQWRVPTILIELLMLMYRFIFMFLDVLLQLQLAQRARGGYCNRRRWMVSAGLLGSQLMIRTLQRYQQFSIGLTARGFNGDLQVYSNPSASYSQRYAIESFIGCMGLVLLNFMYNLVFHPS